jgi:hypothetical protein
MTELLGGADPLSQFYARPEAAEGGTRVCQHDCGAVRMCACHVLEQVQSEYDAACWCLTDLFVSTGRRALMCN